MKSIVIMLGVTPLVMMGARTATAQSTESAPEASSSAAQEPPAPIVRSAPPGMEQLAALRSAQEAPKPAAYWRSGLTLRAGLGVGSFIASESTTDQGSGTNTTVAIGGFPTQRLAVLVQIDYTNTDRYEVGNASDLQLAGLAADWFLTDQIMVGAGVGQAETLLDTHTDASGLGVQGRFGYLVTQRRQHAVDLLGTVTTARFDTTQVTAINVGVGYRFL